MRSAGQWLDREGVLCFITRKYVFSLLTSRLLLARFCPALKTNDAWGERGSLGLGILACLGGLVIWWGAFKIPTEHVGLATFRCRNSRLGVGKQGGEGWGK